MITKNACDHTHHVSPGSTRGARLLESGEFRPQSREGRVAKTDMRRSTHDVRGGRDCGESAFADVDGESNERADERAKLEDGPEDTEGLALVLLQWVAHHDATLCGPKEGGGDTENRTSEDKEPPRALSLEAVVEQYRYSRR